MGRAALLGLLVLAAAGTSAPAAPAPAQDGAFPLRIVKLGGPPGSPATLRHLDFCARAGFNAVWVYGPAAGRWWKGDAPGGPALDPNFLDLVRFCRERGLRIFVSVNPIADTGGKLVFSDPDSARRIRAFFDLLRKQAGIRDQVLSFDDQPRRLEQLRDIVRYDRGAAQAQIELARRVLRGGGRGGSRWLCGSVYSDWHLDDPGYEPYATAWLEGLRRLPAKVGIVWTGPDTYAPSITAADITAVRARLHGRRIFLYDNYPLNDDYKNQALGLVLGPLRGRDPRLRHHVDAYLACPMDQLGGSRLALLTVVDYLRDPDGYDPDASWSRAMAQLAGGDGPALEALRVQGLEWGGWIGTRNYQGEITTPAGVAEELDDPGIMATWSYTIRRYDERIAALEQLADHEFRDDLLAAMRRRRAVALALPVVRGMRGLGAEPRIPAEEGLARLRALRASLTGTPDALHALDRFLSAAGVLEGVAGPVDGARP